MKILENQKTVYEYRGHKIYNGQAVFPNGKKYDWTTIKFMNSVSILPVNVETNKLILLRQYRPAIKCWCIEQVAGGVEPELNITENAKKEVLEEIGYKVEDEDLIFLGDFFVTPGLMNFKTYFFLAKCRSENFVGQQLEETELIETFEISKDDFFNNLYNGPVDPEIITTIGLCEHRRILGD